MKNKKCFNNDSLKRSVKIASVAGCLVLTTVASAQDRVRWQLPIAFPSNLPAIGTPVKKMVQTVGEISGDSVQLRIYEPGELIPPFEILDSVSQGRYMAGYTWVGYDAGSMPVLNLFGGGVPFGLEPPGYLAWHYFDEGKDLLEKAYEPYDVHPILCGIVGPEGAGWYNKPIESVEDFKGLRMRFAGIGGQVMERLGVSVNLIPAGDLYQAMERGTIDATEFSSPAADPVLGMHEIVSHYYMPGWHQSATTLHLLVNGEAWRNLSDQTRSQIDVACRSTVLDAYAESEFSNSHALQYFEEKGVKVGRFSDEILQSLKEVSEEVVAEVAERDDMFRTVMESQQKWMELFGEWHYKGYLPRESFLAE
ncbi:TRAP transporter substrate-binding protein [Halomonas alkalicola]|uniref:TRAP transporter substrate-binding protein n=1 Tax=Halomonas alkalicola TaxID=1930622 RepID=UPI0035EE3DF4